MAIKMVREPSETPNINNIDDIVPMRYAYGNQNGYVINKGTEISNTVSGLNFTVNSGRLVLQGVECDIDATGVTITIDNIATKRYYTVYLEVNLGLNTATIKSEYDTATYPTIDAGDDLTENTTGVARLPLYRFTATSGIISDVNKVVESVKYVNEDFIANVKVNDASKVNNLEIKQDENGVLKICDVIIPQRKLLWSGSVNIRVEDDWLNFVSVFTSQESLIGKTLEVQLAFDTPSAIKTTSKFFKFKALTTYSGGTFSGASFNVATRMSNFTSVGERLVSTDFYINLYSTGEVKMQYLDSYYKDSASGTIAISGSDVYVIAIYEIIE